MVPDLVTFLTSTPGLLLVRVSYETSKRFWTLSLRTAPESSSRSRPCISHSPRPCGAFSFAIIETEEVRTAGATPTTEAPERRPRPMTIE